MSALSPASHVDVFGSTCFNVTWLVCVMILWKHSDTHGNLSLIYDIAAEIFWRTQMCGWSMWTWQTAASRKAEADWQASLRGTAGSHPQSSTRRGTVRTRAAMRTLGLSAIDLSVNAFTDFLAQELCPVLRMEPPIHGMFLKNTDERHIHSFEET